MLDPWFYYWFFFTWWSVR